MYQRPYTVVFVPTAVVHDTNELALVPPVLNSNVVENPDSGDVFSYFATHDVPIVTASNAVPDAPPLLPVVIVTSSVPANRL